MKCLKIIVIVIVFSFSSSICLAKCPALQTTKEIENFLAENYEANMSSQKARELLFCVSQASAEEGSLHFVANEQAQSSPGIMMVIVEILKFAFKR